MGGFPDTLSLITCWFEQSLLFEVSLFALSPSIALLDLSTFYNKRSLSSSIASYPVPHISLFRLT